MFVAWLAESPAPSGTATPATETTPVPTPDPEDPSNPATAAIAAIPADLWINDYPNPKTSVAEMVLKNVSVENVTVLAKAGNNRAKYVLAEVYRQRLARVEDAEQIAPEWYLEAAQGGVVVAQYLMGQYSAIGLPAKDGVPGVEKNKDKALEWFGKAASKGNLAAADAVRRYDALFPPQ